MTSTQPESHETSDALLKAAHGTTGSVLRVLREWSDALIIAFLLAMFIRTFCLELFKIPSGSMSPTLLGDIVAEGPAVDSNGDTNHYLIIADQRGERVQVFKRGSDNNYHNEGRSYLSLLTNSQRTLLRSKGHREEHRILVNKFAYWFSKPERGDIVIFRVPFGKEESIYTRDGHPFSVPVFNRNMAVYVKRCVANEGERVSIADDGRLQIDGAPVQEPKYLRDIGRYKPAPAGAPFDITVREGETFVFGDNTDNSLDSRYWDGVPYANLRGKAFLRYMPLSKFGFLNK